MSDLSNIKQVYFLGIGGIGMSALARWFNYTGYIVSGYDSTETELTKELVTEGISVHYHDSPESLAQLNKDTTLIVITPAIPKTLQEKIYLETNNFNIFKRAKVLGMIANNSKTLAVAGTHGKTSISTMLAHILTTSRFGCSAFLGGISKNYQSNLLLSRDSEYTVCEADEFDRSFLNIFPKYALISSVDADHLDIYGAHDHMLKAFNDFANQIDKNGALVIKHNLLHNIDKRIDTRLLTYSLNDTNANFFASDIKLENEAYNFTFNHPNGKIENITLNYPGLLNVENIVGASAMAILAGVSGNELKKAISNYQGVKRRFDIKYRSNDLILIDDYAHHPEELKATITSVRAMFPNRKIIGIFQPHLFSRTRDFAKGFSEELSKVDQLYMMDIYPARELPIEGVNSEMILNNVSIEDKYLLNRKELEAELKNKKEGVILMMGAGDINLSIEEVSKYFNRKINND